MGRPISFVHQSLPSLSFSINGFIFSIFLSVLLCHASRDAPPSVASRRHHVTGEAQDGRAIWAITWPGHGDRPHSDRAVARWHGSRENQTDRRGATFVPIWCTLFYLSSAFAQICFLTSPAHSSGIYSEPPSQRHPILS